MAHILFQHSGTYFDSKRFRTVCILCYSRWINCKMFDIKSVWLLCIENVSVFIISNWIWFECKLSETIDSTSIQLICWSFASSAYVVLKFWHWLLTTDDINYLIEHIWIFMFRFFSFCSIESKDVRFGTVFWQQLTIQSIQLTIQHKIITFYIHKEM